LTGNLFILNHKSYTESYIFDSENIKLEGLEEKTFVSDTDWKDFIPLIGLIRLLRTEPSEKHLTGTGL